MNRFLASLWDAFPKRCVRVSMRELFFFKAVRAKYALAKVLNRKPPGIPPVRSRREHLLARRGQRPFRALLHDEAEGGEFFAYGVAGELGAAVRYAFEARALGLAEGQQFEPGFLVGHAGQDSRDRRRGEGGWAGGIRPT